MKDARQQILARHRQNCEAENRLFTAAMIIRPNCLEPSDFDERIKDVSDGLAELGRKLKEHNDAVEDQLAGALPVDLTEQ